MGAQPTQVDGLFAYLRKDCELASGLAVEDKTVCTTEVGVRSWYFFGAVREEAKREHLDGVMLAALPREAIQGDVSAVHG